MFLLKAVLLLLVCSFSFEAAAENVSRERAVAAAEKFFYGNKITASRASDVQLSCVGLPGAVQTKASEAPSMYIFNLPGGGFLILSGDDAAAPIMGYSYTGRFETENIPGNIQWWLDAMDLRIRELRSDRALSEPDASLKWEDLESETKAGPSKPKYEPVVELNTALWDQPDPFNRQCYTTSGAKALSGCGPTAMSEIMYFLRLPAGEFLTTAGAKDAAYDWDLMLHEYKKGKYTPAQADAVARLMAENGKRCKAQYGVEETGAYVTDVRDAFLGYKNGDGSKVFDGGLHIAYRKFYSPDQWSELLKKELNDSIPVFYSGQSSSGGHAFVIDGYDTGGNFHFNYGWSGNGNGYFNVYNISYSTDQDALIGLRKDMGGTQKPSLCLDVWQNERGVVGVVANCDTFAVDVPFTVNFGFLVNESAFSISGAAKFVHIDKDGNEIEDVSDVYEFSGLPPGYGEYQFDWPCVIHEKINIGDKVVMYGRIGDDGEWFRLPYDRENGMPAELIIADPQTIIESTSIVYVVSDGALIITVKSGVGLSLTGADGTPVEFSRSEQNTQWIYSTKITFKGLCKLSLDKAEEHAELTLVF